MKAFYCESCKEKLTLIKSENHYNEMTHNKVNYWDCLNEKCKDNNKNKQI